MSPISSFPIQTKTFEELDAITDAQATDADGFMLFDESVGVMKRMTRGELFKGKVIPIDSIADFPGLDTDSYSDRQQFNLGSFAPDGESGGGIMLWEPDLPKSLHDGVNYFSPTVPIPADFNNPTDVQNYLDGVGEEWPAGDGIFVLNYFVSREEFEAVENRQFDTPAQAALASLPVGAKYSTKGADVVGIGGGTFVVKADEGETVDDFGVIQHANGTLGILQLVNGEVNINQFGAIAGDVGTYANSNYLAIQRAIDFVRREHDGGTVKIPTGVYQIDTTILVWERVRLVGNNGTALNFWYNDTYTAKGSVLKLADGSDTDVVKICLSIHQVSNPFPVETNTDRRTMAAVTNLAIDGNRSKTYAHTNKDLNATGNGLVIEGANLVEVHDVVITRCPDDGLVTKSASVPDSQCNNIYLHRIYSCANGGKGFSLSGGDSQIGFLWAGGNGANGITSSMGNSVLTSITANDNLGHGIYHAADDSTLSNLMCYDNYLNGCVVADKNTRVGGKFRHNGRDTGAASTDRCGLVITNAATNSVVLAGSAFYDDGFRGDAGDLKQQYGLRVLNSGITVSVGETHAFGNVTSDYSIADSSALVLHEGIGSSASHPGFVSRGNINFNNFSAQNIGGLSHATPQTISTVTANVLALGANSMVTLNIAGGATVNSITDTFTGLGDAYLRNINASSVTFTAGASFRTKSGANLVLAQNTAVHIVEFAAGVWYEV